MLDYLIYGGWYFVSFFMIMFSLISLYYYLRLGYGLFLQSSFNSYMYSRVSSMNLVLLGTVVSMTGLLGVSFLMGVTNY